MWLDRDRRLRLAGHCYRHSSEVSSNLVLWRPNRGSRARGRPTTSYIDTIERDTGLEEAELGRSMCDRLRWKVIVARAGWSPP